MVATAGDILESRDTPAASLDNHAKAFVEITRNNVSEGLVPRADLADVWADIFRLENRFEASVNHIMLAVVAPGACGHLVQAAVGTRERPQPLPRVEVVRDRGPGARQRIGIGVQHLVAARNLEHLVFTQIPGHGEPSRARQRRVVGRKQHVSRAAAVEKTRTPLLQSPCYVGSLVEYQSHPMRAAKGSSPTLDTCAQKSGKDYENSVFFFCAFAAIGPGGCASPVLDITEPSKRHQALASRALYGTEIVPTRHVSHSETQAAVYRVLPQIRASTYRICMRLELPRKRCNSVRTSNVNIQVYKPEINAFADGKNNVTMMGGLVRTMGTDAEIAAVLAHEFAHVMYGHVDKTKTNSLLGMIVAGGLAGVATRNSNQESARKLTEEAMEVGAKIGSRVYSPEMEIEADRSAIYILKDVGFPATAMRDVVVRFNHAQVLGRGRQPLGRVGFLQTHPSNDRRMAHILSAIEDATHGVPLKVSGR